MSKVIDAIKFGVLPPDEIRRLSVYCVFLCYVSLIKVKAEA